MFEVRHPKPDEDLTSIWPWADKIRLNLEQVLIVTNEEGKIEAGVVCWDAGHDLAYMGELEAPGKSRYAVKALVDYLMEWLDKRGITAVMLTCEEGNLLGNSCERHGARMIGYERLMMLPVKKIKWNPNHRWSQKIGG